MNWLRYTHRTVHDAPPSPPPLPNPRRAQFAPHGVTKINAVRPNIGRIRICHNYRHSARQRMHTALVDPQRTGCAGSIHMCQCTPFHSFVAISGYAAVPYVFWAYVTVWELNWEWDGGARRGVCRMVGLGYGVHALISHKVK